MPLVLDAKTLENRGAHWLGVIARKADDLKHGAALAAAALDAGLAAGTLAKLVQVSNRASPPPNGVAVAAAKGI